MKQRYKIIEKYKGINNGIRTLATTDKLFYAVKIIEHLNAGKNENPYYSFDFIKIDKKIDNFLDWYPNEELINIGTGKIINCKNYEEFIKEINEVLK